MSALGSAISLFVHLIYCAFCPFMHLTHKPDPAVMPPNAGGAIIRGAMTYNDVPVLEQHI